MEKNIWEGNGHEQGSLSSQVFNKIQDDIINGRYKPGDSLVETKLAEELGVSRTPVREAIRQLELEGLVTYIPNKGVYVTGITKRDIEDIYTIRSLVEGLAVRWAIERIEESELKKLEETVELMEYYTEKGDMEQVTKLDTRFHEIIYDACKSRVLQNTLKNLLRYVKKARLTSLKVPKRAYQSLEEHKQILNAFKNHELEKGEQLMIHHISRASLNLHGDKENGDKLISHP